VNKSVFGLKISKSGLYELVRYAIVGVLNNALGFSAYLFITWIGVDPKLTLTILYGVAATIGYWGHKKVTFEHEGSLVLSGVRYVIAHLGGYALNLTILYVLVDTYHFPHQWVQFSCIFIVAAYLFFTLKFFVFTKKLTGSPFSQ